VSADETFAEPNNIRARQAAGTVHVHPNGRFVYGAWSRSNGSSATTRSSSKEQHARALMRPDAHPMEMSGRLMEGYVQPAAEGGPSFARMARARRRVRQNFTDKAAEIAGAAGRGDVASGAERDGRIE